MAAYHLEAPIDTWGHSLDNSPILYDLMKTKQLKHINEELK